MGFLSIVKYSLGVTLICVGLFTLGRADDVSKDSKLVPQVCGVVKSPRTPSLLNGTPSNIGDSPWHASLYIEENSSRGSSKKLQCGATVIHPRYLLTAAHCVHDEIFRRTVDAGKLFIKIGNTLIDYDSPPHDTQTIKKRGVKNVFVHHAYKGLAGYYASDIALLELEEPFEFSDTFVPACWDDEGHSKEILKSNAMGKVTGPGRTAAGESTGVLQTVTMPYVPYKRCASAVNDADSVFVTKDKFCTSYTNGTAFGEGCTGGGLVLERNGQWYITGIVSVGVTVDPENGKKTWDVNSNSLCTKVSNYVEWIKDVMVNPERYRSPSFFSTSQILF